MLENRKQIYSEESKNRREKTKRLSDNPNKERNQRTGRIINAIRNHTVGTEKLKR